MATTSTSTEQEMVEESSEDDETEEENLEENNTEEPPRPEQTADQSVVIATPPHRTVQELPNLALVALRRLAANNRNRDDESPDDFKPLKRRRLNTKTEEKESDNDIDEGQCCSICFDPWSNSGIHRIASLKCGHLFGYGCIEKWLKTPDGRCPQCNSKAKKKDIRVIFAKSISVVDTTERDRALKEVEEEKMNRIIAQKSEAQSILQYHLVKAECDRVKQELVSVKKQLEQYTNINGRLSHGDDCSSSMAPVKPITKKDGRFELVKTIIINGSSRVMAHDSSLGMIVTSKKSTVQLFADYGLMKISLLDLKPSEYVPIHDSVIRDVVFSPRGDGLTLTTGIDKSLHLTSMHSNTVVQKYSLPVPSWACCWNLDDSNYVYCGLVNGTIMTFDLRQTAGHVTELKVPNRNVPLTSLAYVPLCRTSCLNCSGLLMGTLDGTIFWEKDKDVFNHHTIESLSGACTNISFETSSRHCLASFRPSKRTPKSRHIVCQLQNTPITEPFTCNQLHQFDGGNSQNVLSRSLLFQKPNSTGNLMVAYGNEQLNSTHICDFSSTSELQLLRTEKEPCIDISLIEGGAHATPTLLNLLTDSKLHVYKWKE